MAGSSLRLLELHLLIAVASLTFPRSLAAVVQPLCPRSGIAFLDDLGCQCSRWIELSSPQEVRFFAIQSPSSSSAFLSGCYDHDPHPHHYLKVGAFLSYVAVRLGAWVGLRDSLGFGLSVKIDSLVIVYLIWSIDFFWLPVCDGVEIRWLVVIVFCFSLVDVLVLSLAF